MTSEKVSTYYESTVELSVDPLTAVSRLAARGFHDDYIVYESAEEWSFASGIFAEIFLDCSGAWMRKPHETLLPWDGSPLAQVQSLLDKVPAKGWRAYGWAAFELAYVKDGDLCDLGDQRLLHLVVPRTEVRLRHGRAQVRSADREMLPALADALTQRPATPGREPEPVDVRRHGGESYRHAVEVAVKDINADRFQKVILSRKVPVEQDIDFVGTYIRGRHGNNPARSFLLRLGGIEAAGFCPELVVKVGGDGKVLSQPLAGTRALTADAAENERLRTELLSDPKEIYEHAISVKTAYDELDGVCLPGSINVDEFMVIKERGSVQHLASRVSGRLAPGQQAWNAFGAVFPAVTASGVPKDAAYASIRSSEQKARGLYSGAVLMVEQDGTLDAALVLRAVYRQNGMTWLQAGAGIVGQSLPEREFEETCEKLDSVARFLVPAAPSRGARQSSQPGRAVLHEQRPASLHEQPPASLNVS